MAKEKLSAAAQEAQDYLQEQIEDQEDIEEALKEELWGEKLLDTMVKRRTKAEGDVPYGSKWEDYEEKCWACRTYKTHIEEHNEALDWLAIIYSFYFSLNIDEYKKRCRIRKLNYTMEQWEADEKLLDSLEDKTEFSEEDIELYGFSPEEWKEIKDTGRLLCNKDDLPRLAREYPNRNPQTFKQFVTYHRDDAYLLHKAPSIKNYWSWHGCNAEDIKQLRIWHHQQSSHIEIREALGIKGNGRKALAKAPLLYSICFDSALGLLRTTPDTTGVDFHWDKRSPEEYAALKASGAFGFNKLGKLLEEMGGAIHMEQPRGHKQYLGEEPRSCTTE